MLMLFSTWSTVLLARFLQGLSMQQPEKKALLSLFNIGMPEGALHPWSEPIVETLAILDAVNQGLIFVLSDFSRHVKHHGVAIRPWLLFKYISFGLSMAMIASMSTWNGTMDAGADLEDHDARKTALFGVGIAVAVFSGLAVTYFAYSRGVETNDSAWYPGRLSNRLKFWGTAILSNAAQGILSFYQVQQATGSEAAGTVLTLLSLVGMNGTQMRVYGVSLARSEELTAEEAPQVQTSKFARLLCGYLTIANWFNLITAPAMLRMNLSQIKSYKAHQDELAVLIPTLMIGSVIGIVTVALVNSFRLNSIKKLCSEGVPTEFKEQIGLLKAKLSLPCCEIAQAHEGLEEGLLPGA
jgi:hypothetical protein